LPGPLRFPGQPRRIVHGFVIAGEVCGISVSIADCGSGVRHFGQSSPASCGTMTAAHVGQERMLGTVLPGLYGRAAVRLEESS
jgi:hypothetical protein